MYLKLHYLYIVIIIYFFVLDGGTPVEKYIIEKRPKFGQWEKAAEVSGKTPKCTVPNLTEGQEYEFRVVAVNKAGPSMDGVFVLFKYFRDLFKMLMFF